MLSHRSVIDWFSFNVFINLLETFTDFLVDSEHVLCIGAGLCVFSNDRCADQACVRVDYKAALI